MLLQLQTYIYTNAERIWNGVRIHLKWFSLWKCYFGYSCSLKFDSKHFVCGRFFFHRFDSRAMLRCQNIKLPQNNRTGGHGCVCTRRSIGILDSYFQAGTLILCIRTVLNIVAHPSRFQCRTDVCDDESEYCTQSLWYRHHHQCCVSCLREISVGGVH